MGSRWQTTFSIWFGWIGFVATSLSAAPAAAAEWRLDWRAPASCPSALDVKRDVDRLVTSRAANLQVTGVVEESATGYHVELTFSGDALGSRALDADTCPSLARAVALIVALALDPNAATSLSERLDSEPREREPREREPREPERNAALPPISEAPPAATPPPSTEAAPSSAANAPRKNAWTPRFSPLVGVVVESTWIPQAALGFVGTSSLSNAFARVDVFGGGVPSSSTTTAANLGATLGWAFGGLRGCGGVNEQIEFWFCAQARGIGIDATGNGGSTNERVSAFVVTLEPGLLLRVHGPSRWLFEAGGFAVFPTSRPRFIFWDERGGTTTSREVFRVDVGFTTLIQAGIQL